MSDRETRAATAATCDDGGDCEAGHTAQAVGRSADERQHDAQKAREHLSPERRSQLLHRDQLARLGSLVAGVAHEINNPLAALIGLLDLLKDLVGERDQLGPPDIDVLRDLLLACEGAADRIRQIVFSLKDMGRVGARESSLFDPSQTIRDAVRLFAVAKRKQCRVHLSASALPAVRGSPGRLGQVIINLLQNGLDAAGPGATLLVRSDTCDGDVQIFVSDEGPGIPSDVATRIFEPFCSTKGSNGMGLGLSICREIVERMGGTIGFKTGPKGTTFHVVLPGCGSDRSGPAAM